MKRTFFPIVAFALAAGSACADPGDVFGMFATEGASSHVRIADCGDGSPCGTVVWIDPASLPAAACSGLKAMSKPDWYPRPSCPSVWGSQRWAPANSFQTWRILRPNPVQPKVIHGATTGPHPFVPA